MRDIILKLYGLGFSRRQIISRLGISRRRIAVAIGKQPDRWKTRRLYRTQQWTRTEYTEWGAENLAVDNLSPLDLLMMKEEGLLNE